MEVKKAKELFRRKEKYNCIQAVLKAYQHINKVSDKEISVFSKKGAGRIENGMCGALYAAKFQLKDKKDIKLLTNKFIEIAGSEKCNEIRKLKKCSCSCCVETAASLLKLFS